MMTKKELIEFAKKKEYKCTSPAKIAKDTELLIHQFLADMNKDRYEENSLADYTVAYFLTWVMEKQNLVRTNIKPQRWEKPQA